LVNQSTDGKSLYSHLDERLQHKIREGTGFDIVAAVKLSPSALRSIVEQVRTSVLNWCLDLEKAGVVGAGMTFTVEERKAAATVTNNIHFHESVKTAQIQQGTSHSSQSMTYTEADLADLKRLVENLVSSVGHLNLASEQAQQLVADLRSVEGQLTAPRPSRGVITEAMKSVRNISEGVAGNIIAAELLVRVGHYIGLS
jgi:AbiTii